MPNPENEGINRFGIRTRIEKFNLFDPKSIGLMLGVLVVLGVVYFKYGRESKEPLWDWPEHAPKKHPLLSKIFPKLF